MNVHSGHVSRPRRTPQRPRRRARGHPGRGALDLFAQRGFHGTVTPLVANLAHVGTRGTIYRHFGSKEGLVNALYQKWKTVAGQKLESRDVYRGDGTRDEMCLGFFLISAAP